MSDQKPATLNPMRFTSLWIILLLLSGFFSGYFALSNRLRPDEQPDASVLSRERERFSQETTPEVVLNLAAVYSTRERELLNPELGLPQMHKLPVVEMRALFEYAETCETKKRPKVVRDVSLRKAALFQAWICHDLESLPTNFIDTPPYMHPNGSSYAYQVWRKDRGNFKLEALLPYFHAGELKFLEKSDVAGSKNFSILAGITSAGMTALNQRSQFVLLENKMAFLRSNSKSEGRAEYQIVSQDRARDLFSKSGIRFDEVSVGKSCWMEEGNICWNIDYDRLYAKKRLPTWGMTLLSLAIGLFLSLHLRSTLKREAREKERQINAYRILAHELRTPIAVLRMNVDTLRGAFDSIPEGAKIACLRIFDQVSRLMRLADKSRDYLALETKPFAASKAFTILDLKALVEESIEELKSTSGMGEIELLEVDPGTLNTSARGDLYWAGVCIRNLLSNAATHGKPPIQVRIRELKAQVEIEVKDAGVIQKQSEKASKARTDGLGIGLSITENLMKEMGGKLIRQEKPTRFSLVFQISGGDA